jgi:hypothetical protein
LVWGLLAAEAALGDERGCCCMVWEASKMARGTGDWEEMLMADGRTVIESGDAKRGW